ncbi:hypothetical protein [Streptomyces sp. NPDC048527]|uniref:hypothetical protein n=1 Tax=Streptomyces sp. NPDC048527 TaxID=3365568 RepID=UPI0037143EC8
MVAEYDAAPSGEKGAVLRRERLHHSHIIEWRQAREAGALGAPAGGPRRCARRGQPKRPSWNGCARRPPAWRRTRPGTAGHRRRP